MTFILELVYLTIDFTKKRAEYSILVLPRRASLCNKVCLITVCINTRFITMNLECSQNVTKVILKPYG